MNIVVAEVFQPVRGNSFFQAIARVFGSPLNYEMSLLLTGAQGASYSNFRP
jgi:hypothetical protein